MITRHRDILLFLGMALLLILVGVFQSWQLALTIFNLCVISAVMSIGVNVQWGVAGMFNVGTMGFAALGGLAVVLFSAPPVTEAWSLGGPGLLVAFVTALVTVIAYIFAKGYFNDAQYRWMILFGIVVVGFYITQRFFFPAVAAIEGFDAVKYGNIGGLGLPTPVAWFGGALLAGLVAWPVAKLTGSLRTDYLAVATFGISEIVVAVLKNEDWLARGVKNISGLPRPVPYEVDIRALEWIQNLATSMDMSARDMSSIVVKLCYAGLFLVVLALVYWLTETLQRAPWGRMMRAIRDNEDAAMAMGKDVEGRHRQAFVLGSAIVGIGGAMLVTLDGQFTPGSYQPLRFTFIIWIMVIVGGSGNYRGAILGAFVIWFAWIQAETGGAWVAGLLAENLTEGSAARDVIEESAAYLRYVVMGRILILVMRFAPHGLIPEKTHTRVGN